jgi:hypothetical protein
MPKKSAAHQKKVDAAVRILDTTTGVNVPQAMILAGFLKQDITNETICRMMHHRLEAKQTTPPCRVQIGTNNSDLSDLTGKDNELAMTMTTMTSASLGPTHPKPKREQIRSTASAIQQRRIDNLAAKRHKSDMHKAAVCLYKVEKQKPNGLSVRQVQAVITAKYEVCLSIASISRYVKQVLVNASPMKMGPVGRISAMAYKFLCQAYSSLIPINQMNACAGDNSRKKMIPMLVKTFDIRTIKATGLFNHVVCNTATDINAANLNCAEDYRIRWMTF